MRRNVKSVWNETKLGGTLTKALGYVLFFSLFINLLILTSPIYMMQVFDRVLVTSQVETLVYLTLIAVLALITLGLLDAVRGQLLNRVGSYLDKSLRVHLLTHTIAQSRADGENRHRLLDDLSTMRGYMGSPAVLPMVDAPWVPLFLVVISILHPYLGLLAAGAAVVLFALALVNDRLSRNLLREASAHQAAASEFSSAAMNNSDSIHAMGMQEAIAQRYNVNVERMTGASQRAADVSSVVTATSKAIRIGVQVGVLALGAYLVTIAELTAGGMIAASIILGRALAPVEQSIGSWRQFRNTRDAFGRIRAFLTARPTDSERISLPDIKGGLSVEDVSHRMPGAEKFVLQQVKFVLEPGTALTIIGPSASGKSTLCKLIVGSWKPTVGKVRVDGAEIVSLRPEDVSANIGYLPQSVELFSGTAKENIARLGAPADEAVIDAAKSAGCHEMILRLPDGYETELGPHATFLSGGQRQRIGLARALYGNPSLIVLDEPNASLDQAGEAALVNAIIERKASGATFILVSHRMSLLQPVDKIAVLRDGKMERFGARDEILAELAPRPVDKPRSNLAGSRQVQIQ